MEFHEIKFSFDTELTDNEHLDSIFTEIDSFLGYHLDENLNMYPAKNEEIYDFKDFSNLNQEELENEINHFFNFNFNEIYDVPLYKFLVIKNNGKLTVLANIHSSIFNYGSIKLFKDLFNNPDISLSDNCLSKYDSMNSYLNSSDFNQDAIYWKKQLSDAGKYLKFYNIRSDLHKNIKIPININNSSKLEFITAAFSLYLSRVDNTEGCILKTNLNEMNSLLKIDYHKDNLFSNHLNEVKNVYDVAAQHSRADIENYIDEDLSFYSIYDFSELDGVSVKNGENSALTLNVYADSLELIYNSDLFDDVYMEHMAKNIGSLLDNVSENPNQKCGSIDILSEDEKVLISDYSVGKQIDWDKNKTLARAFRQNAIEYPDLMAIDDGINQITYSELESSTNSIAYDLINNYDIEFGDCIGLMLPRSYHFPELVLALNKIGVAFTPIDQNYPLNRIEHMLDISESKYIITTKDYAQKIDLKYDIIFIEDLRTDLDKSVECLGGYDDLFAVFFTSGTTGLPKGVMVLNKQINSVAVAYNEIFKTSAGDLTGYFASFSFIASIRLFIGLIFAESCRLFNEIEQKDSLLLIKALKEQEMTDLILPPSVGIPIFENEDIKLKHLILAGAKLNELSNKSSTTHLVNFYGTTELLMSNVKIFDCNSDIERVSVGGPVPNTWAYVLDDEGMTLPIGVPGEICISSKHLSPGYYNDSDLTDEVFVDNPYSTCEDNKIMYRTGDVGFYNFEGEIEIIGRKDNQLSVRGFRIESDEILNVMNNFPEISDVYLDVDYDNLIAYYVSDNDFEINDVKDALSRELPYYMVPSLFIELDSIPLNPNGKLDKFALKSKSQETSDIFIGDDVLQCVADAFKEVLDIDNVFIDDDFVQLGGNSLSVMKLQLLLNERLGVNLSSAEVMELATPVKIADYIKYNLEVHSPASINYSFEDVCPLSESQLNVYLDEKVNDMGTAYNNPFKIDFYNRYSADEIKNALDKLLDDYPVLSARIVNVDGDLSFSFDANVEISQGNVNDIDSFVRPFDFDRSLSRFLIAEGEDSVYLCLDCHHLIFDGTSANILLDRLISILDGNDIDLIDNGVLRGISYEENIAQEYMDNASEFFDSMLADRDEVYDLLPCVKTGENNNFEYIGTFDIDNDYLISFLEKNSITHNQFFTGVFAYTLSKFSGSSKVLFNLIEDGRGHIDLSESVGMFVRTLPLLIDCQSQNVSSFLEYSGGLVSEVMKYDLYPFRILANQYDLNSDILFQYSHSLFDNLLMNDKSPLKAVDLKQDLMGDLSFFIFDVDDNRMGIRILYSDKFSDEFIERFAESYKLILKGMIDSNNLSDINYTLTSDLDVLNTYNRTENALHYEDILDAFNDNLASYPDNPLVSYNDRTYSYGEGAFIANGIANLLNDKNIEKNENIAFIVERSELYMFSALAILSIGAVYVPIDDALPDERIKFILEDTDSKVVLVSDETYERVNNLIDNEEMLLNISGIAECENESLSNLPVTYSDLACILYTSGTTGIPKGVKITRKGITSFADCYVNEYNMKNNSTFGMFSSIGFDVGAIRAICGPLYGGSCLNIVPMDIRLNIDKLNEHFINHRVTHTSLPTQVARMFVDKVEDTSLEVLITGGEKLGEINESPDYLLIDSYGPTETCVSVCTIEEKDKIDSSSVGYLLSNVKAYVLDEESRRVPVGAVGELCIAGNQVADGYLNRLEETRRAFIDNPFESNESYSVLYRTGDLVRVLPDGSLGIVGRRDGQVKIRGNRVELQEIESAIREINSVESVTVQAIEHEGNYELVAYVVSENEDNIKETVCSYIAKRKPDYMVPSFVITLDNIPLNVNGKVDRNALPEVDRSSLHAEYAAPRNENEKIIVEAFEKIFSQEKIGVNDDFVALGGDSLTGIKLMAYLEGYGITMSDILNLRTPAAIANNMEYIPFDLDIFSVEEGCPLNEAQASLLAGILADDNADFYHLPMFMPVSKKYGLEKILGALDEMFKVHPILSMHLSNKFYVKDKKNFIARFQEDMDLLKDLGESYQDSSLVDVFRASGWNPKKLYDMFKMILKLFKGEYPYLIKGSKPPVSVGSDFNRDAVKEFMAESMGLDDFLCMFAVYELENDYLVMGKFHHFIFDGMSINVFKRDFQRLLDGGTVDMDDSFLKTSAFQHQAKDTELYSQATEFFEDMFNDLEEADDFVGDTQGDGFSISNYDLKFDKETFSSFLENAEISENILFTSVFACSLSRFVDSDNVLFSTIDNGRGRFNDYDSIGLYASIQTLLINCKNQSIDSYLEHSSQMIYGATKYNFYSILLLYKEYGLDMPSVFFQFVPDWLDYEGIKQQDSNVLSSEFSENMFNDFVEGVDELPIDFVVQLIQNDDNYSLMIANSNNFSDKRIDEFNHTFESILSNIISADLSSDLNSI